MINTSLHFVSATPSEIRFSLLSPFWSRGSFVTMSRIQHELCELSNWGRGNGYVLRHSMQSKQQHIVFDLLQDDNYLLTQFFSSHRTCASLQAKRLLSLSPPYRCNDALELLLSQLVHQHFTEHASRDGSRTQQAAGLLWHSIVWWSTSVLTEPFSRIPSTRSHASLQRPCHDQFPLNSFKKWCDNRTIAQAARRSGSSSCSLTTTTYYSK